MRLLFQRRFAEYPPASVIALLTLCLHLGVNLTGGYGYFRDEFYYIACCDRLAWGYVDHPPLSIALLALQRLVLGDSVFALRLLPALAAAGLVYLTGLLTRFFGGGRTAEALASLAALFAPVYLAVNSFYSMNAFEPLFWAGAAYVLLKLHESGNAKLWLLFGAVAGQGLLNKHSMLFFGFALVLGLVVSPQRKLLANRWFLVGGAVAFLLFLPNLLWQSAYDWPTLEFMRNAQQWKNAPMSPVEFLSAQVLFQHPIALPLWLAGLAAFFFHPQLKKYRYLGVAYLVLVILFITQRGKPYYLSPVYPVLLAAGGVMAEGLARRRFGKVAVRAYAVVLCAGCLATLPLWVPVLPVETYVRYSVALGLQPPRMEQHTETVLPQVFADRFGWEEMVAEIARAYRSLSPEEQSAALVYTQNYGQAGAVDFFGGRYGLPPAISGHNSYWLWGVPNPSARVLIILGGSEEHHREVFSSVELFATHRHPYAMPFETDLPIYICRRPVVPLREVWTTVKRYI